MNFCTTKKDARASFFVVRLCVFNFSLSDQSFYAIKIILNMREESEQIGKKRKETEMWS